VIQALSAGSERRGFRSHEPILGLDADYEAESCIIITGLRSASGVGVSVVNWPGRPVRARQIVG
jgi:hypothetical protein